MFLTSQQLQVEEAITLILEMKKKLEAWEGGTTSLFTQ